METVSAIGPKGDNRRLGLKLHYFKDGLGVARGVCSRPGVKPKPGNWWRIYHVRSGMALPGYIPQTVKEGAKRIDAVLAYRFDWLRSQTAITKDKKFKFVVMNWQMLNLSNQVHPRRALRLQDRPKSKARGK